MLTFNFCEYDPRDAYIDILAFKYPIGFKYPAAFIFDFVDAYGPKMTVHRFLGTIQKK